MSVPGNANDVTLLIAYEKRGDAHQLNQVMRITWVR